MSWTHTVAVMEDVVEQCPLSALPHVFSDRVVDEAKSESESACERAHPCNLRLREG